ncbi:MAG: sporulation initiation inhibitor protein Soj [Patescibacteria group bacterium]
MSLLKKNLYIISFVNHKGGVGKTTTVMSVAGVLVKKFKKKVLCIDLDPQANLTKGSGVVPANLDLTLVDILRDDEAALVNEVIVKRKGSYDVLPSSLDLALADQFLYERVAKEIVLREIIENIKEKYDFILIDSPPSLGVLTINGLSASTHVLLPVETSFFALEGFESILDRIKTIKKKINTNLDLLGIVATKFDSRKNIHKESLEEIRKSIPEKVFKTTISMNVRLEEAPNFGKSIIEYSSETNAKDYINLTKELLKRL